MSDTPLYAHQIEVGYVNGRADGYAQWDETERVPELQWPNSVNVFRRMMSEDGRVSSVLEAISLPIIRSQWRIDQNGASDEVTAFVASNLGLPMSGQSQAPASRTRGRFSWSDHLQDALQMLVFGHSFFEQVYRRGDDGRFHLRKLAPRPQETISRINVAPDGGLVSIEQMAPASGATVTRSNSVSIPVSNLVAYVRKRRSGVWTGQSILRPAYKHWLLKDEFMRIQAATARRNGMGVPVGTAAKADDPAEVEQMHRIASAFRGGMNSGIGLANGQTMQLLGVQGNLPDMHQAIEYHDKQIALAGLAHFLNLDRGGSYNLASVLNDTFVQSVQTIGEQVRDVANAHIVEDLVDLNFGRDALAPRIVFDEIGSRQDATAASLALFVQAGLLTPDEAVKIAVRQQLGLPDGTPPASSDPNEAGGDA
ncbi:hypothetical protein [Prescottella equi]|uniref:phage portal protein family protein n=1 Tax=Rhodococcus hoagii TaxID=43767 RepID=UPI0002E9655F|nr:hypothetical protein [Prescottella equi]